MKIRVDLFSQGIAPALLHFATVLNGGGKKQAAPDYQGAAQTQATASKETTAQQNFANRPNIYTPWGSQTWDVSTTTDPTTGVTVPQWSQNVNLTPESEASLKGQQQLENSRTNAAQGLMGQVADATANPFPYENMPKVPGSLEEAQQGAFSKMSAALEPGRAQQQGRLDTRLANMGLPINSSAYNNANSALQGNFAQENKGLLASSLAEGRSDVTTQSQMRQQAIAEEAQRRGMPLNEMNALLNGQQVNMPQGFANAPNTTANAAQPIQSLAAAQAQGNFQSQNQNDWGSAIGGIASVAGVAM